MTTRLIITGISMLVCSGAMTSRVAPMAVETGDIPTWLLVGLTVLGMLVGAFTVLIGFRDAVRDHGFQLKSLQEKSATNATEHKENERQHKAIQGILHRLDTRTARIADKVGVPDGPMNGSSVEIMPVGEEP